MFAQALSAIDKIAFTIGSLEVAWYGIILVFAMILGLTYLCIAARRINLTADDCIEMFLWVIPLAVVFARVFYVLPRADEYFPWNSWDDFVHAIAIWEGGITIIGGLVGGLIGVIIFAWRVRKKANFGQIIDLAVGPLLLGQITGRVGNFINQEAFGIAIHDPRFQHFPFAVYIDNPSGIEIDELWEGEGWYAATFFYEMVWNAIGLAIIYAIWRKNKKYPGILGFVYFFWYFLGRGLLEFIRLDAVPVTQVACFVLVPVSVVLGILYIVARRSRLSFIKVNDAAANNLLYVTELSEYDVKNYKFCTKVLSNPKNPLGLLYKTKEYAPVDIEAEYFLEEQKPVKIKKNRFKRIKKEEE